MRNLFFLFSFIALFLVSEPTSAQWTTVKGNGNIVNKTFQISEYTAINALGSATYVYEQKTGAPYLRIETDENILPLLKVEVKNNALTVCIKEKGSYKPTKLIVYTNSPSLNWIKISGSGNIQMKGNINIDNFELTVAGSGNIHADHLYSKSVSAKVAGSGNIKLGGKVENLNATVAGSGDINTTALQVTDGKGRVAGSGNLAISANKTLDLAVAGRGNIRYKGSATVNTSMSGSGKIIKEN